MIIPPFLKAGDVVGVVAPAGCIEKKVVDLAVTFIEESGFKPYVGSYLLENESVFSAPDSLRTKDMQSMIDNPSVSAIICARGGYGSSRIIDDIDFTSMNTSPKWICGFSDITVFHSALFNRGIASLHCEMPINFEQPHSESEKSITRILKGDLPKYAIEAHEQNIEGKAEGIIVGGNLSVLYSLLGTKFFPKLDDKILFIEDVGEYLYHIDRMMQAFHLSGVLKNISGIVVGGMNDMRQGNSMFTGDIYTIINRIARYYNVPLCFNFPAGHIDNNYPLLLGGNIKLDASSSVTIDF